jgi:hypothetical protein
MHRSGRNDGDGGGAGFGLTVSIPSESASEKFRITALWVERLDLKTLREFSNALGAARSTLKEK